MNISPVGLVKNAGQYVENRSNNNNKKPVAFKGAVDGMVNFWHFVDAGGAALKFTVEDMFGTNIPRTYKGAVAGYKYTKKLNIKAALQEGVREFLTGPTMCTVPILVLSLAKKSGKTANTKVENIRNLSYLMEQAGQNVSKEDFYKTVISDLIKNSTNKEAVESDVNLLLGQLHNYQNTASILKDKDAVKAMGKKAAKSKVNGALETLEKTFEQIVKNRKDSFVNSDFTQAKYSINGIKTGSTDFKNYIGYMTSFAEDFGKKFSKDGLMQATQENINNFKGNWIAKRLVTIGAMIGVTGALMSIIPKLYTIVSGDTNPNATAIYDAAGQGDKTKTEEVIK